MKKKALSQSSDDEEDIFEDGIESEDDDRTDIEYDEGL